MEARKASRQTPPTKLQFLSHISWGGLKLLRWSLQPFFFFFYLQRFAAVNHSEKDWDIDRTDWRSICETAWRFRVSHLKNVNIVFAVPSLLCHPHKSSDTLVYCTYSNIAYPFQVDTEHQWLELRAYQNIKLRDINWENNVNTYGNYNLLIWPRWFQLHGEQKKRGRS